MKITGTPARTCEGSQSGSGTRRTPCLTRSSQGPHGPPAFLLIKTPIANRLQRPPSCKQHRRTQSMTLPSQPTGSRQHPLSSSRACTVNKHTRTHICMHTHAHTFYKANTLDVRTLDEAPRSLPAPLRLHMHASKMTTAERADTPVESIRAEVPSPLQLINSH